MDFEVADGVGDLLAGTEQDRHHDKGAQIIADAMSKLERRNDAGGQ